MIFNEKTIKFFSLLVIFLTIASFYPTHEARAFLGFLDLTFTSELPCPLSILNCLTLAQEGFDVILKPLAIAITKTAIRAVVADLKNQTIRWIVTGQFGTPQFVSSFQVDPRKIAENASRIFLSRITNINFCNYQPPVYNSNLLFSVKLGLDLQCSLGSSTDISKFARDWRKGRWSALWGITNPQNNYWDVVERAIVQKQLNEQKSLSAYYNEILTNAGFTGLKDSKGKTVTPGQYLADSLKETVHQDYPTIDQIDEWSGIIQAIGEIVNAGLKQVIQKGLTTAFK